MSISLSIADVERDTGLSKDTLRVWERRYGFPKPRRDPLGERLYPVIQVEKLRVIKRLLDAGHRPGRVVARPLDELRALADGSGRAGASAPHEAPDAEFMRLLQVLRGHDAAALTRELSLAQARLGLRGFVIQVAAPLSARVGEAWMRGEMRVFEEHLFTECLQTVLHAALGSLPPGQGTPRVLLATLPGEPHGLGLLMAQSVLAVEGCACLSLGVQVPLADLVDAAESWRADVVALSVTGSVKRNQVLAGLQQLRAQLPGRIALWVGGAAPALRGKALEGIVRVPSLEAVRDVLGR
jgi:DNA-binding transcriptional MerR regulator/methylmalonyl-CoA mutase cobalamin-binding subunit